MRTLNPNTLERVENYITEYQKKNGKSPSYRQIMHGVGMSSLNLVQRYVLALEREGRIERTRIGNISVPPKLKPSGVAIAPLVGSIACGQPVDAVENIEESFALPRSIFGNGDLFMLRTFGDSKVIKVDKSKIPFELEGERWLNFFEGNEITDKQISVCYRHKQRWEGPVPAGKEEKLKNLLAKINGKEEITVLFYGDSITTGAQSSAFEQISPKADIWPVMVCKYLEKECGIRVNYINEAVGGYTTNQGAQNFEASVNRKGVDLLVLAFGMNDKNTNGGRYKSLIQEMAESFHKKNPSGEVLLVSTMTPNYETDWYGNQVQFADELIGLESEYDYCACADITNIFEYLFEAGKRFRDVTVNNVNHPNDFGARLYAQVILKTILGDKFEERYDAVKG